MEKLSRQMPETCNPLLVLVLLFPSKRITNPDTTCLQMADKKKPNSADDRPQETDRQFLGNLSAVKHFCKVFNVSF